MFKLLGRKQALVSSLILLSANASAAKGILLRVGIDQTFGGANAPARGSDGSYAYWPIPETGAIRPGLGTTYAACTRALELPRHLVDGASHLDPDFEHLTYGDLGRKGSQIRRKLSPGDFIVFYAAFRDVERPAGSLVYGLFGFFEIETIAVAREIPRERWHLNAHTRRELAADADDVVVFGRAGTSGRFDRIVPIGEYRRNAYRVREDLLEAWGGLGARDGFIQRSGGLNFFRDPARFLEWLEARNVSLVRTN